MNRPAKSIALFFVGYAFGCFAQNVSLPAHPSTAIIVKHNGFTLEYLPKFEQAKWVFEVLTKDHLQNPVIERSGSFKQDLSIPGSSATPKEYSHTGYDKGHLAPAADMKWSAAAMHDCFYMSNMSPQKPSFNRGIWGKLEDEVRKWALEKDTLYVISGGILHEGLKTIGNHIAVPDSFYKVILDLKHHQGIGFVLRNEGSTLPLNSFEITIDSVESLTGIHFFPALPDDLKKKLEATIDPAKWGF
jgi:endonuclease G, mitochondrial